MSKLEVKCVLRNRTITTNFRNHLFLRHISAPVMSSLCLQNSLIITVSNEQATDNYLRSAFYCIQRFIPYAANSIKVVFQKA